MTDLEYNPIKDIINHTISSYALLLSTYETEIEEEIVKDTKLGIDKYNKLKNIMSEIKRMYPGAIAYFMKPNNVEKELGINENSIINEMKSQVGGTIDSNAENFKTLKKFYSLLKNSNLKTIEKDTIDIFSDLKILENTLNKEQLNTGLDEAKNAVIQSNALSSLSKFIDILKSQSQSPEKCAELLRNLSSPKDTMANNPLKLKEDQQKIITELPKLYENYSMVFGKDTKSASGISKLIMQILSNNSTTNNTTNTELLKQLEMIPIDDNMYRNIINKNIEVLEKTSTQLYVIRSINSSLDKANQIMESYIKTWKVLSYEDMCKDYSTKLVKDSTKVGKSLFRLVTKEKLQEIKTFVLNITQNMDQYTIKVIQSSNSKIQNTDPNILLLKSMLNNVENLTTQVKQQNIINSLTITANQVGELLNAFNRYKKLYGKLFWHQHLMYTFMKYLIIKMIT
jgi:hypothetical protein